MALDVPHDQLLPVIERAAGCRVAGYSCSSQVLHGGVSGGQVVRHRIDYSTGSGAGARVDIIAKRCVWQGRPEAVHYRHLLSAGVPVPALYGSVVSDSGEEIVFLEALEHTGFRRGDDGSWMAVLSSLARLNACPVTPEYAPHLYEFEQIGVIDGGLWSSGMRLRLDVPGLERSLGLLGVSQERRSSLVRAADELFGRVAAQPKGLIPQDFRDDNVGWRGEQCLIFDLHKLGIGPRFADAAPLIGLPDWSERCGEREALIAHYLREYGHAVSRATFLEETADLFWAHKVSVLSLLIERGLRHRAQAVVEHLVISSDRDGGGALRNGPTRGSLR